MLGGYFPVSFRPGESRLLLVQKMAHRRYLRVVELSVARALQDTAGEKPASQRRDGRF